MPWELNARPADGGNGLGTLEQVQSQLQRAVPDVVFFREQSGAEKLAALKEQGVTVPPAVAAVWKAAASSYRGIIEGVGVTIELNFGTRAESVEQILIDVRGDGDLRREVQPLLNIPNWRLTDAQGEVQAKT